MEEWDYHKYSAYDVKVDLLHYKLNMFLTSEGKFAAEYGPPKVHQ